MNNSLIINKLSFRQLLVVGVASLTMVALTARAEATYSSNELAAMNRTDTTGRQVFIDKFTVPQNAIKAFRDRTNSNMKFITKQPGFVKEETYQRFDEQGNLIYVTIVVWENEIAIRKAKEAAQAEYKRQGFNPATFIKDLHIQLDRGTYNEVLN